MQQILAVALLDCRRLGYGLVSAALVAGLIPLSGLGPRGNHQGAGDSHGRVRDRGRAAGEFFGSDFAEGKSSFYFARPLPTLSLIAGRFAALLALAAMAFVGFMASFWISSSDRSEWSLSILTLNHLEALGSAWSVSLFLRLAVAAHGRAQRSARGWREVAKIPVRIALSLFAFIIIFGLFADLLMRAYLSPDPARLLMGSWVTATLIASLVAIAAGRTEGLRIARVQNIVMACYVAAASVVVITSWSYILHPGPDAISGVNGVLGSPDGKYAYLQTSVNRGESGRFQPIFILDLASGQARRLNSDPAAGPWVSADGATMVWGEATPIFFRPLWRLMGGSSNLRIRAGSGDVEEFSVPRLIAESGRSRDISEWLTSGVDWVLPSTDGSVFALRTLDGVAFTSRSGALLSQVSLGQGRPIMATAFLADGALRAATLHQDGKSPVVEFLEIDPRSGSSRTLTTVAVQASTLVQLDARAERALVTTGFLPHPVSITLVNLGEGKGSNVVLGEGLKPTAEFLADGRIVATVGGGAGVSNNRRLRTFSPTGQPVLDITLADGEIPALGAEVFPGVLGMQFMRRGASELALFDVPTGTFARRLPGFQQPRGVPVRTDFMAPPGTPAARLILSAGPSGGKLYDLPSLQGEPRLILPLPRS